MAANRSVKDKERNLTTRVKIGVIGLLDQLERVFRCMRIEPKLLGHTTKEIEQTLVTNTKRGVHMLPVCITLLARVVTTNVLGRPLMEQSANGGDRGIGRLTQETSPAIFGS